MSFKFHFENLPPYYPGFFYISIILTQKWLRTYAIRTQQKIEANPNVLETLQFWSKGISKRILAFALAALSFTLGYCALFDKEKIIRSTPPTQFSKEFIKMTTMTTTKTTKEFFDPGGHCSIATISHHYTIIPDPRPTMTFILRTDPFPPITNPLRLQLPIPTRRTDK